MRKAFWILIVMALVVAACKPAGQGTTTTLKKPPPDSTSSTSTSTSTTSTSTTSTTLNSRAAAQANIESAKDLADQLTVADGGKLAENGQFVESEQGFNPFEGLEMYTWIDEDGFVVVYIEGPADLIRRIAIEFDALEGPRQLVNEATYRGFLGIGYPAWMDNLPDGRRINDSADLGPQEPSPEDTARLGAAMRTVTTVEEFADWSTWLYSGLEEGFFTYAHFLELYDKLLANTDGETIEELMRGGLIDPWGPADTLAFTDWLDAND